MVKYKYADLFEQDNVDKRWKIAATDFAGYGIPYEGTNQPNSFGKTYLDLGTGIYYRMENVSPYQIGWKELENDFGIPIIKNEDLFNQSIEITENLCSENELRFGSCEAGSLKFKVANIVKDLSGMWLTVSVVLNHNEDAPFLVGRYKVDSDKLTADRMHREIVAYDAMHDIINASMVDWYNTILPEENSWVTMKQFRTSFVEYLGLEQQDITLVNDGMIVEKTIQVEEGVEIDDEEEKTSVLKESSLSGKDVITAICEINGCFGHIGRDGRFHYIYLPQDYMGLYPSETLYPGHAPEYLPQSKTGSLYPQEPDSFEIKRSCCISCQYEDFLTGKITKLQIRQEENDIGVIHGEGDNKYTIEGNFLVYGKGSGQLRNIAKNIYEKITNVFYCPFTADIRGNLCLEVGDAVRLSTKYDIVESYILNRTLKGGQALRDSVSSKGVEKYSEKVNSVHNSIIQLKGKANILSRTIEETKSTIVDVEGGLQTQITQNAESITAEAERAQKSEEKINGALVKTSETLSSKIEQTAENITSSVDKKVDETKKYADGRIESTTMELSSKIDQTAEHITQEVSASYETKTDAAQTKKELSSSIEQTATSITQEVSETYETKTSAGETTERLSSKIEQTAREITSTVAGSERLWIAKDANGNDIAIDKYGYGPPPVLDEEEFRYGLKYLDQSSGIVYSAKKNHPLDLPHPWTEWDEYRQLELISTSLESRISQTLTGIELGVKNNDTGTTAGITIKVTSENGTVQEEKGEIVLNGLVSFTDMSTSGKSTICGDNITTGALNANLITVGTLNGERINTATLYLTDGLKFKYKDTDGTMKIRKAMALEMVSGQTYPYLVVGGTSGSAGLLCKNYFECRGDADFAKRTYFRKGITVEGGTIDSGNIYMSRADENVGIQADNPGTDSGLAYMLYAGSDGYTVSVGFPRSSSDPTTTILRGNSVNLVSSSGPAVTSDERLKNSFKPLDEFEEVYMDIEPCAFKYNNGNSGRYHFGVKAGNVKDAFEKHGYTTQDFGGFVQMADSTENEDYCGVDDPMGIIYTEFTMWNMQMVQKLYKKVEEQGKEIASLKETVFRLLERNGSNE